MNSVFEQAQRFTEIWTDFATKMATSGMSFEPGASPPEASRQVRSAMFQAMSQFAEEFMRSPQFLEMAKQSMDAAITFRQQLNSLLTNMHHNMQGVARQDVDSLQLSIRHMETRVLDRIEELSSRVEQVARRLDAVEGPKRAPKAPAPRRRSPQPSPTSSQAEATPRTQPAQEPGVTDEQR